MRDDVCTTVDRVMRVLVCLYFNSSCKEQRYCSPRLVFAVGYSTTHNPVAPNPVELTIPMGAIRQQAPRGTHTEHVHTSTRIARSTVVHTSSRIQATDHTQHTIPARLIQWRLITRFRIGVRGIQPKLGYGGEWWPPAAVEAETARLADGAFPLAGPSLGRGLGQHQDAAPPHCR